MKLNILIVLFIGASLNFSCEKEDGFEVVSHEVYKINEITKGGCFDYNPNDTMAILPITNVAVQTYINDGYGMVEFSTDYSCLANDSIELKGNVLKIFLSPNDTESFDCNCVYSWVVKLDIIENKGLKILYYELENGKYQQKQEMYNHSL